jgi:signal transduction histidine kinase
MCKNIVEQMHGIIRFETEEGKGTTFFVTLPLLKEGTESRDEAAQSGKDVPDR